MVLRHPAPDVHQPQGLINQKTGEPYTIVLYCVILTYMDAVLCDLTMLSTFSVYMAGRGTGEKQAKELLCTSALSRSCSAAR